MGPHGDFPTPMETPWGAYPTHPMGDPMVPHEGTCSTPWFPMGDPVAPHRVLIRSRKTQKPTTQDIVDVRS